MVKGPELVPICRALGVGVRDFLGDVMKAQLLAVGEAVEEEPAAQQAPPVYISVPLMGDLDSTIRVLRERFKKIPKPEDKE